MIEVILENFISISLTIFGEGLRYFENCDLSIFFCLGLGFVLLSFFATLIQGCLYKDGVKIFLIENKKKLKLSILNFCLFFLYLYVVKEISISQYILSYHVQNILLIDIILLFVIGIIVVKQGAEILGMFSMMFEPFLLLFKKDIKDGNIMYKKNLSNIIGEVFFLMALYCCSFIMKDSFVLALAILLMASNIDKKIEKII